jgi:hypothetical protein
VQCTEVSKPGHEFINSVKNAGILDSNSFQQGRKALISRHHETISRKLVLPTSPIQLETKHFLE